MDAAPFRIGSLARAAGVGVETIRYYQRLKLLDTPPKPYGGQRVYAKAYADRLRFIRQARALGFTLEDVATLLALNDGTGHARARKLALARLDEIEARIARLAAIRDVLRDLVRRCEHAEGRVPCPIVATIAAGGTGEERSRRNDGRRIAARPS